MEQGEKIKQNWNGPKKFEISFCVIFSYYDQNFNSGRETEY